MAEIVISIRRQELELHSDGEKRFVISSAEKGLGEAFGSFQTPRGKHIIRAKIGAGLPINSVLVGRRPTGEIYTPELGRAHPNRDWILSRILWLSGSEPGRNRLGKVDTMRRYIYIHGSPDEGEFGVAHSHGCIRMRSADIVELFDRVKVGAPVLIEED